MNKIDTIEKIYDIDIGKVEELSGYKIIIRTDGSSFSRFTKRYYRPLSLEFHSSMRSAAKEALLRFSADLAFVGSDEVSVIIDPTHVMYSGRIMNNVSLMSSIVTVSFFKSIIEDYNDADILESSPTFKSKMFVFKEPDVLSYLKLRQLSILNNSMQEFINMASERKIRQGSLTLKEISKIIKRDYSELLAHYKTRLFVGSSIYKRKITIGDIVRTRTFSKTIDFRNFKTYSELEEELYG